MLNAAALSAIEQEVRQCFIHEDAPEHLAVLEQHLLSLEGAGTYPNPEAASWREVLRSIHTLKGSAALSQLQHLSHLAHRLEDVLLSLGDRHLSDPQLAIELLLLGVDQMRQQLAQVAQNQAEPCPTELLENIELLLAQSSELESEAANRQDPNPTATGDPSQGHLQKIVLETDFKSCLQRSLEQLQTANAPALGPVLQSFALDCQTLGEILSLDWLKQAAVQIQILGQQAETDPETYQEAGGDTYRAAAITCIQALERQRQATLSQLQASVSLGIPATPPTDTSEADSPDFPPPPPPPPPPALRLPTTTPNNGSLAHGSLTQGSAPQTHRPNGSSPHGSVPKGSAPPAQSPATPAVARSALAAVPPPSLAIPAAETDSPGPLSRPNPASPAPKTPEAAAASLTAAPEATMRLSVSRLNALADVVGDLLIHSERVSLDHQRLRRSSQELKRQTRQFYRLREKIQSCYDELLLPGRMGHLAGQFEGFDALEMDQFTDLHTLLQDLQEFLARIDEYADDIDLLNQSAQESQSYVRQELDTLRQNLTEARMVRFETLADRFRRPLWDLNQRYGKEVKFQVEGGETEIDRAILDYLYDPLLHLVRNAFDHGQEMPADRRRLGKSPQGTIVLSARQAGTSVIITVTDDGRGIDLAKIQAKAEKLGLLPPSPDPNGPPKALKPQKILNCLFTPGFSTADKVGELSGRGVGLDVVKTQLERLRGSVQIQTMAGKGTRFILMVPSTLNILPLLLCQQNRPWGTPAQVAIPSSQVLELVEMAAADLGQPHLTWQDQTIPLLQLQQLLPAPSHAWQLQAVTQEMDTVGLGGQGAKFSGAIAVVLQSTQPIALQVDTLLEEREMVLKALDSWLPVPPYLSGCTLLPQGQVVPVLSPESLLRRKTQPEVAAVAPAPEIPVSQNKTVLVVDDSVAARRWLSHAIEATGYQVVQCRDGQEAWERLQEGLDCRLVVSDVEMPRLDGFQLLRRVRQDDRLGALPVAMLTSRQGDRHLSQAEQLGATAYFTKPLGIQELVLVIDDLCEGKSPVPKPDPSPPQVSPPATPLPAPPPPPAPLNAQSLFPELQAPPIDGALV